MTIDEELKQIMFTYRRDEISVNGALEKIKALINSNHNGIKGKIIDVIKWMKKRLDSQK